MFENFLFCVNAIVPLFLLVAIGCLVRQLGWLSVKTSAEINKLCFRLLLPCSLFRSVSQTDLSQSFNPNYIVVSVVIILVWVLVAMFVFPFFVTDRPKIGSMIQGSFRSNAVLLAFPLSLNFFGDQAILPVSMMTTAVVLLYNVVCSVILLIFSENADKSGGLTVWGILKDIVTNNLIIGILLGALFSFFNLPLPDLIADPLSDLSAIAAPLTMIMLGAQFNIKGAISRLKYSLATVVLKLIVFPLFAVGIPILLGIRGMELGAIFLISASPVASSSYIMAQTMGCDGPLAADILLFSTAFSVFTLFIGSFFLISFGFF